MRHTAERLFCVGLILAGCGASPPSPVSYHTSVFVRTEELAHVPGALEATIVAFVGETGPGGGALTSDIPTDFLTQSTRPAGTPKTSYTQLLSRQAGIRLTAEAPINRHLFWIGSVSGSVGESDFLLPDGAGVLIEPISIRFRTLNVEAGAGLKYSVPVTPWFDVSLSAGAGLRLTQANTRIDSPVLAAHHRNLQSLPYVVISGSIELHPPSAGSLKSAAFNTELRHYPDLGEAGISLGTELNLNF